jgi:phenol 2-monooxygenase
VIDVRAIFQQSHRELSPSDLPPVLLPRKGRFGLIDYEKAFCPDQSNADIFDLRGIDRDSGCVVIVRPDQYVSDVLALTDHDELSAFFDRILNPVR